MCIYIILNAQFLDFKATAGVEWDGVDVLREEFGMADIGTPRPQTPPSCGVDVPPAAANLKQR